MRAVAAALCLAPLVACHHPSTMMGDDDTTGPDAYAGPDFCNATDPRMMPVAVAPTPESGETPYTSVLNTAQHPIRVEIYEMGYGGILGALKAQAQGGVDVKIIFDMAQSSVNQKYSDQLAAVGAQVKWSDPKFTYQHAKFFVVDGTTAVISTGNFSKTYSIDLERNFAVTDSDPADMLDLVNLFDADWGGVDPA